MFQKLWEVQVLGVVLHHLAFAFGNRLGTEDTNYASCRKHIEIFPSFYVFSGRQDWTVLKSFHHSSVTPHL